MIGNFLKDPEELKDGLYWYGMRLRGFSPGAQPKGVVFWTPELDTKYYNTIAYEQPLTEQQISNYDLDYLFHTTQEELNQINNVSSLLALCNVLSGISFDGIEQFANHLLEIEENT